MICRYIICFYGQVQTKQGRDNRHIITNTMARLEVRCSKVSPRIVSERNSIPAAVIKSDCVNIFKNRIDEQFDKDKTFFSKFLFTFRCLYG